MGKDRPFVNQRNQVKSLLSAHLNLKRQYECKMCFSLVPQETLEANKTAVHVLCTQIVAPVGYSFTGGAPRTADSRLGVQPVVAEREAVCQDREGAGKGSC